MDEERPQLTMAQAAGAPELRVPLQCEDPRARSAARMWTDAVQFELGHLGPGQEALVLAGRVIIEAMVMLERELTAATIRTPDCEYVLRQIAALSTKLERVVTALGLSGIVRGYAGRPGRPPGRRVVGIEEVRREYASGLVLPSAVGDGNGRG